ncbi:MAG: 50S ribosomal protein L15 [Anaerolineae bacterium]|nr:50S ribosomal protein L15 [Anaerolineae bacterium]
MKLHDLQPAPGAKKQRMRKARGIAAGKGKTAGRGTKGQKSRSGGGVRPYFEGGQLPLVRRLPQKPGFRNRNRIEYTPVNLQDLAAFEGEVTPEKLAQAGLIKSAVLPVVILGEGELQAALTVRAHRVSSSARAKIEAAGGAVEILVYSA